MRRGLSDLEPEEREVHELLAGLGAATPPLGLRDVVLRRIAERRVVWEWLVAALLAIPSALFLVRQVLVHGDEFAQAFANVVTAASSQSADASFFVDGLTVVALALLGVSCAVAAHAASRAPSRSTR